MSPFTEEREKSMGEGARRLPPIIWLVSSLVHRLVHCVVARSELHFARGHVPGSVSREGLNRRPAQAVLLNGDVPPELRVELVLHSDGLSVVSDPEEHPQGLASGAGKAVVGLEAMEPNECLGLASLNVGTCLYILATGFV